MKQVSANGLKGTLIRSGSSLYFRVYSHSKFTDYEIQMHDIEVQIKDSDAFLKEIESTGEMVLDYSNETLGYDE